MAGELVTHRQKLELTGSVQGYHGLIPVKLVYKLFNRSPTWFSAAKGRVLRVPDA